MPSESAIISEIEKIATHSLPYWAIGITSVPEKRKSEHNNPIIWHYWDAGHEFSARRVEKYFVDKGMKCDSKTDWSPHYVYLFWGTQSKTNTY